MKLFDAPKSAFHLEHHPALLDPLMDPGSPFMLSHISSVLYNHFVPYFLAHPQVERKEKPAAECGLLRGIPAGKIAFDFEEVKYP